MKTERIAAQAELWGGRIKKLVIFLVLAGAIYWSWTNRSWIAYKLTRQYDVVRYGLNWKSDRITAANKANREKKELLIVFLRDNDQMSKSLETSVFPAKEFKVIENNYVLLLCDYNPKKLPPREKDMCEQLMKMYDTNDPAALFVVVDPANGNTKETRRLRYAGEHPLTLLHKIAGGKFIPKPMVDSTPRLRQVTPPTLGKDIQKKLAAAEKALSEKFDAKAAPKAKTPTNTPGKTPAPAEPAAR
ncbi:MAG: hypothetical protein PHS41_03180 [Victivallaceae bacterium]|nr:hypothetical protein [Victivallaceae bacterium]